jgi:hypothetical protein
MNKKTVVIIIVCLVLFGLATFVVPAIIKVRTRSGPHHSRFTIHILDKAIEMYHGAHNRYPGKDLFKDLTGAGDDDGQPGYGYRLEPSGRVYDPWNGTDQLAKRGDPPHFVDSFGNEIEYHRFEDMPDDVKDYNTHSRSTGKPPVYYRRDYILRSRGPNGKWDPPGSPDSDDITNMAGW